MSTPMRVPNNPVLCNDKYARIVTGRTDQHVGEFYGPIDGIGAKEYAETFTRAYNAFDQLLAAAKLALHAVERDSCKSVYHDDACDALRAAIANAEAAQ